jgi:hypothetical protein
MAKAKRAKAGPMTDEELKALPVTVDVPTAGRAYGWGKTKSNELARAEEFPVQVLTRGRSKVVTKAALLASLGWEWDGAEGWRPAVASSKASAA